MEQKDTGILLNKHNIELHRKYFEQMVKLIGIQVIYRALKPNESYDSFGELDDHFEPPMVIGCIFDEHPTQITLKKMGWVSELQPNSSIIHVPYDVPKLRDGCLFIIPSGLDHADGRLFRIVTMSNIAVYPASIACEIAPVYVTDFDRSQLQHINNDFNLLIEEDD